jgi:hypothetical protein
MDTRTADPLSIRQANKFIRRLRLKDNDIVILRHVAPLATPDNIDALSKAIGAAGIAGVTLVVIDDFDDLKVLDSRVMAKHGWIKIGDLAQTIVEKRENTDERKQNDGLRAG